MSTMGLTQSATVYTRAAGTGQFTTVAKSTLKCRLVRVQRIVQMGDARVEQETRRKLLWESGYDMPNQAQIEVDSERWNVVNGTEIASKGPSGTEHHRSADLVKVT